MTAGGTGGRRSGNGFHRAAAARADAAGHTLLQGDPAGSSGREGQSMNGGHHRHRTAAVINIVVTRFLRDSVQNSTSDSGGSVIGADLQTDLFRPDDIGNKLGGTGTENNGGKKNLSL